MSLKHSLLLEVLNQALHVPQLSFQLDLLIAQPIELSAQVGNVGLKHALNVGAGGGLVLEEAPFGLQHLVLLLQETDLWTHKFSEDDQIFQKIFLNNSM